MRDTADQRWDTEERAANFERGILGAGTLVCGYGERSVWSRCTAMTGAISDVVNEASAADLEVVGLC